MKIRSGFVSNSSSSSFVIAIDKLPESADEVRGLFFGDKQYVEYEGSNKEHVGKKLKTSKLAKIILDSIRRGKDWKRRLAPVEYKMSESLSSKVTTTSLHLLVKYLKTLDEFKRTSKEMVDSEYTKEKGDKMMLLGDANIAAATKLLSTLMSGKIIRGFYFSDYTFSPYEDYLENGSCFLGIDSIKFLKDG